MKIDTFEWVKSTFIKLTSKTSPYGTEDGLVEEMIKCGIFPADLSKDQHGNYFYKIGNSRSIFASHLDTACQNQVDVNHVILSTEFNETIQTDGSSILGADDKAGVTILLWMMKHNIPGLYYFFQGEEVGCIGSTAAASVPFEFSNYDRIISFDRRGTNSVITHQSSIRTCSDGFADALSKELNATGLYYRKDDTGVYTDSAEFAEIISECSNISVGYYSEHTTRESQNITHLTKLANASILVNWENLPTLRDKTKKEYKSYGYYSTGYNSSYSSNSYNSSTNRYNSYRDSETSYKKNYFLDNEDVTNITNAYSDEVYGDSKDRRRGRRRWNKNKFNRNRVFLESGPDLREIEQDEDFHQTKGKYDIQKDKFIGNTLLTFSELEIVRDQYLDFNDPSDGQYFKYLMDNNVKW